MPGLNGICFIDRPMGRSLGPNARPSQFNRHMPGQLPRLRRLIQHRRRIGPHLGSDRVNNRRKTTCRGSSLKRCGRCDAAASGGEKIGGYQFAGRSPSGDRNELRGDGQVLFAAIEAKGAQLRIAHRGRGGICLLRDSQRNKIPPRQGG